MAPSQLKQLKAAVHARKNPNAAKGQGQSQPQRQVQKQIKGPKARPKSEGEERRRRTLLPELQHRHKAGGIVDRRIGENDPTMPPEERMLQRYAKQRSKRGSMFNLEDDEDEEELTHLGRSIFSETNGNAREDFEADDVGVENGVDEQEDLLTRAPKRRRLSDAEAEQASDELDSSPARKKSKNEVMQEVVAKSKLHKYERQQRKEEDDALREELDKGLPDLLEMLRGKQQPAVEINEPEISSIHPDRAALISQSVNGTSKQAEQEYDLRLREMAMDQKAQPSERTKTTEEKALLEADRLKKLEESRMQRMKGEEAGQPVNHEEEEEEDFEVQDEDDVGEAAGFGLNDALPVKKQPLEVEDEDEFVIDDDLVASGSDIDLDMGEDFGPSDEGEEGEKGEDDDEFLKDVLPPGETVNEVTRNGTTETSLPYTYPCPQDHGQLKDVLKGVPYSDYATVVQRIRALYHPQLRAENKEKLSNFTVALIDHVSYLGSQKAPITVIESLIRHAHSMSKNHGDSASNAFRSHLRAMHERSSLAAGDLVILTAIGSIFPPSDHFHQVVTPAITIMARWLGMNQPRTDQDAATGAYLVALCLKYQGLSKRYIPEAIRFTGAALQRDPKSTQTHRHVKNLTSMMDLWADKGAFVEMFSPFALDALDATGDRNAVKKLRIMLSQARLRRRPLELHHHRPLPIKTSFPKFEEDFDPNKHYDPDRERAQSQKLRAEYKREKKGALRELKKDASFLAREKLKAKKEADRAYEAKQRRLIAEIQSEEGREKNAYEREKSKRKGKR